MLIDVEWWWSCRRWNCNAFHVGDCTSRSTFYKSWRSRDWQDGERVAKLIDKIASRSYIGDEIRIGWRWKIVTKTNIRSVGDVMPSGCQDGWWVIASALSHRVLFALRYPILPTSLTSKSIWVLTNILISIILFQLEFDRSTKGKGGKKLDIEWNDDGKSPKLSSDWGSINIFLATGSHDVQFKLQELATGLSNSKTSGHYRIDQTVGPSGSD